MVLFSEGQSRTPLTVQGRLVYMLSYTLGLVLLCAYSAAIISFLTVQKTNLPITSLEQLHQDKTYTVRAVRGSSTLEAFRVILLTQTAIQGTKFLECIEEVKTEVYLQPHFWVNRTFQLSPIVWAFSFCALLETEKAKIERAVQILNYNKETSISPHIPKFRFSSKSGKSRLISVLPSPLAYAFLKFPTSMIWALKSPQKQIY